MVQLDTQDSRLAIFLILVILTVPSILCSFYIFYHFIRSAELRRRINNHVVLLLLIIAFIQVTGELPLSLIFLRTGSVALSSDSFCRFWIIFDYMLFTGGLWTMAVASIQRYWLVFHRNFFDKHLFILHYIPLGLCVVYPMILYITLITKYPCESFFDYTQWTCGGACYLYEPLSGTLDWVINGCLDVLLSLLATCIIIFRVLIQKSRVTTQRSVWHRRRRVIIQLIALSVLYMVVWLPCVICFVITLLKPVPFLSSLYSAYLSYYQFISSLLCPFACLLGFPEIRKSLRSCRQIQPRVTLAPQPMTNHSHRRVTQNRY